MPSTLDPYLHARELSEGQSWQLSGTGAALVLVVEPDSATATLSFEQVKISGQAAG